MRAGLAVILDANILIRFAIGRQVSRLLATYAAKVDFLAPDTAFIEARRSPPTILHSRGYPDAVKVAAELGKVVCATFAVAARRSVESLWGFRK